MCLFNKPVAHVSKTNIFVAPTADAKQVTIYQNSAHSKEKNAMVLPFPVPKNLPVQANTSHLFAANADIIQVHSMSWYKSFFSKLDALFPSSLLNQTDSLRNELSNSKSAPVLQVVQIGDYQVCFIVTFHVLARLVLPVHWKM